MIFGHLGIAFLLKSKFYKRSLILLIILCYIPDIIYYVISWLLRYVSLPLYQFGLAHWLLSLFSTDTSWTNNLIPVSHSVILYVIFISVFLIYLGFHNRVRSGLVYSLAIVSHLAVDIVFLEDNIWWGVSLLYPFDPNANSWALIYSNSPYFWFIYLIIFIVGFFTILWAFSKHEGRQEFEP